MKRTAAQMPVIWTSLMLVLAGTVQAADQSPSAGAVAVEQRKKIELAAREERQRKAAELFARGGQATARKVHVWKMGTHWVRQEGE